MPRSAIARINLARGQTFAAVEAAGFDFIEE